MQDKPESHELLTAIADFLMKEVMPAVRENDALAYKTLVSWNMLGVIAREIKQEDTALDSEALRLEKLTGKKSPESRSQKRAWVKEQTAALSREIRDKKLCDPESEIWLHVKSTLSEKLATANPRFAQD